MARRRSAFTSTVLGVLFLGGCAVPVVDEPAPEFDKTAYFLSLGACHGADAARFALTGVGNVIGGSVVGFVEFGGAGRRTEDALALAVLGSTIGGGVGVVKTFEDWEPGVAGCLSERGYVFAPAEQSS